MIRISARLLATTALVSLFTACQPDATQDETLAAGPATGAAATPLTAPEIDFTRWQLQNGLTVIAVQDPTTATVTTSMWYDVGAKNDPAGRSGFAHLFEHILSRKTENMPYNMIYSLVADAGGTRNASTSQDRTNYFEQVPAEFLETMLWTHRERMALSVVDDQVFETERGVVKEELRTRVLAPPYGIFQRFVVSENAYDLRPQRRAVIGSIADLDAATLDDARAFHQAFYGPDTATLIVAGNFQLDELRTLVERYFGAIAPRAAPVDVAITVSEPRRTTPRTVAAHAPAVPLPLLGSLWQVPEATHPDIPALEVLAAVLARGDSSRLHQALVESGKAVGVAVNLDQSQEAGTFMPYANVSGSAELAEASRVLAAEIARVRDEPVSEGELAEARTELLSDSLRQRETARGRAFELGEMLVLTGDPGFADRRLAAIAGVSAADVQRVAQTWLAPEARVDLTYERGPHDPAEYASPVPMPRFASLPPATGASRAVLPESERQPPPAPGVRPLVASPTFATHTLANGMQVISAQTGNVPLVTLSVLFSGGSASDSRQQAGLANMAALLASKGSTSRTARDIAAQLEGLGAEIMVDARSDGTVFSLTAPADAMAEAGVIMADFIRNPSYPAEEVERERARMIAGLQVQLQDPGSLAAMAMRPLLYGDAPYGNLAGGTLQSLATITREDLLAHSRHWWHPGTARVVVTGGIDNTAASALVSTLFGDWQVQADAASPVSDPAGVIQPVRTVVIDMPEAGQAAVYLASRAPLRSDREFPALELANAVLGGGSNGRLFEEIRTRRSLSYGAYSALGNQADDPAITADAQTANETADEVAAVMLAQFARMVDEQLDADTVARRRVMLAGARARTLETGAGFGNVMLNLLAQGIDPQQATRYAELLDEASAEEASAAAARWLDPDRLSLVIVGNAAAFIDDLRAVRPDVEVIPAREINLSSASLR